MPDTTPAAIPAVPATPRRPVVRERFGERVEDPYAWLGDRTDPEVLAWLTAQNERTDAILAPTEPLRELIFAEIKARTVETDLSVPWRKGAWWYYDRTVEGQAYPLHCRRPDDGTGLAPAAGPDDEEVLLDENALAAAGREQGFDHLSLGILSVSPDGSRLAWSVDRTGRERHELHVTDLATRTELIEPLADTSYGFAWAADSATFLCTTLDAAERPHQVWRHRVGAPAAAAGDLVFDEPDERYFVDVGASRSGRAVVIESHSTTSSEVWVLDAHDPTAPARVVAPRRAEVEYAIAHHPDGIFVVTNGGSPTEPAVPGDDFALWRVPATGGTPIALDAAWTPVGAPRSGVRLEAVEAFAAFVVLHERRDGVARLRVRHLATGAEWDLTADEALCTMGAGRNAEFDVDAYRYGYTSFVTPSSVYAETVVSPDGSPIAAAVDDAPSRRQLLKRQEVRGVDLTAYRSARTWATAADGTRIPVSVVWHRDRPQDGSGGLLLEGYGAYEHSFDPFFSISRLSVLDRGVAVAVAHVRGGGELGRPWYTGGKLAAKPNTFSDFVAAAHHLVAEGWCAPGRIVARGRSAGGLLMGAVANLAPDAFRAVVAEVPFVDALTTMLDPTLPLTVTEWEEWGNPVRDEAIYRVMRGYAPYENVRAVAYPAILATAGLHDPRVGFHEPAKWVARLQAEATNGHDDLAGRPILLRTEMGTGHGGPTGRYDAWREEALVLAFVLDQLG